MGGGPEQGARARCRRRRSRGARRAHGGLARAPGRRDHQGRIPGYSCTMKEKPTILAIDDDPVVTQYLESKLGANYRVVSTNIPADAVALARAERPDLIMVDVDMNGLDGFELCRRLKIDGVADAPVVFLTGRTDSADEVRGFEAG